MNNLTKTKTATADAKFLEMAQDVVSAASTKQSTKSDVTKVSFLSITRGAIADYLNSFNTQ